MAAKGGTRQACAACKYQRRRCSADCPLAPYFPPDQPKQFQNAHRLFGVSNILKILNNLEPPQKAEAMRSIIYEANVRDRHPVHGCLGLIFNLHLQIQHIQLELDAINAQLSLHRHHHQLSSSSSFPITANTSNHLPFDTLPTLISIADSRTNIDVDNNKNVEAFWTHNSYDSGSTQTHSGVEHEYDEISPYFDTVDEDPACESSSELSLKDTVKSSKHASENELKGAAACFTLTSVMNG
ncbi:LOB domain-containing protein 22-like [Phoenix dactylifera]|uniref:LOB domain-containing protein 22-like n=1 Tax=Phoenix dactylifera TaxID=42345 RepID=A0A8B7D098_PHODC|nr:LOB domain-containing protein 22-like [Phoenix dactylifera]